MHTDPTLRAAAATLFLSAAAATALSQQRFDPETGRNLANYPPSVFFDHKHLKLTLDIPDIETAAFDGVATLTTTPIGVARSSITLNARKTLSFSKVTVGGEPASFVHENDLLTVTLPRPAAPGAEVKVEMTYHADKPTANASGLNWFKTRKGEGREKQGAMVYSQGESDYNSYWFPCHDYPNDKLTTEIVVTVDSAYEVVSNGRVVAKEAGRPQPVTVAGDDGGEQQAMRDRTTWHWLQDKPHATYLVMLAIGKFDIVDVNANQPGVPMPVYGPVGSAKGLKEVFKNTPEMVKHFEQLFDEPYPWDKYAQVIVRNFRWGGMENTSATTLAEYAAGGEPGSQDDLISHELVHQWFGDLMTCRSWDHLWLNEGWATLGEWLWTQKTRGDDAYLRQARQALNILKATANKPLPEGVAMVSRYYQHIDDNFTKAEDPYKRGGFFLHMLRERLGDDVFWKGVRLYIDRYKFQSVETGDFRRVMEEVSGQSLERFFDQWAYRPSMPTLKVTHTYNEQSRKMTVTVEQTQKINADNPAYALRLPVYCEFPVREGEEQPEGRWLYIDTDTTSATEAFDLPMKPNRVRIDPNASLLARINERSDND
ncbi:MAG TPA: M1 family metallopeptidase [Phycisphaerales bacterium]|nr:M1 family metallopeptidase [Phycisphaerales bacterium]